MFKTFIIYIKKKALYNLKNELWNLYRNSNNEQLRKIILLEINQIESKLLDLILKSND